MRAEGDGNGATRPNGPIGAAREPAAQGQEASAHYKKMYDRASALAKIGVWEYDLDTQELMWTDGVYDLFDLPRGSRVERSEIVKCYTEESYREMERRRAEAIRTGGSFKMDIQIRTLKGNQKWIRLTADVEQENGRSARIFGTKQDVSQEKEAQEKVQLLQTELIHVSRKSAMGAMAATLAHELNQPLTAISNYVAGTRRALDSQETGKELLDNSLESIEKCAFRASNIIRSLREITKGDALSRQLVNPNPIILEAGSLATAGTSEDLLLRYDLADDVPVLVDSVQIQQVLINLIRNAAEAVRDSSRREIVVSTSVSDGTLKIHVDDTGHGIAPEKLETIFEFMVSSKPEGMGIGLSISRTIVEAHGGRIWAANRAGGGARFYITLPLDVEAQIFEAGAR